MARPKETKYREVDLEARFLMAMYGKLAASENFKAALRWISEVALLRGWGGNEAKTLLNELLNQYSVGNSEFFDALAKITTHNKTLPNRMMPWLKEAKPPEDRVRAALLWSMEKGTLPQRILTVKGLADAIEKALGHKCDLRHLRRICHEVGYTARRAKVGAPKKQKKTWTQNAS